MNGNTIGKVFKVTTFGESHGESVGAIIEGCPAGIEISLKEIQTDLDRRKPGKNSMTSSRKEPDKLEVVSGIKDGKTTGGKIKLQVKNVDVRSNDYNEILYKPRPGHADLTNYLNLK